MLLASGDIELNPGPGCTALKVCHVNIRSLSRSKLRAIQCDLVHLFDIITLSETHLHSGIPNDVFQLNGYHDIIRRDRGELGGGVAIYIKDSLKYKRMVEFERPDLEAIWVQLNTLEGKVLLSSLYRPPDKAGGPPPAEFWDKLDTVIDDIKSTNVKYLYLLGDLNADFNTANGKRLHTLCLGQNLHCLVEEPTRITQTSATVLDQILTNAPNFVKGVKVLPPVSTNDHCTVSLFLNFKIPREHAYLRHIWQYSKADVNGFRTALANADFDVAFQTEDVDVACQKWSEIFLNLARTFIPNNVVTVRPCDSPWYDNNLRLLKRKMMRMFRKFKEQNRLEDWYSYKQLRNDYQQKLDEAETKYVSKMSSNLATSRNTRSWWNTVKWLIGRGADTSYPTIKVDDNFITDNREKASQFNLFFLSHSTIDTSNAVLPEQPSSSVELDKIIATESEVSDLIKSIDTSKATGADGISPKLVHLAGPAIIPSITKLINLSLSHGVVPKSWKEANVIPLYKKGDRSDINNYRPVSILPCLSKILERIVFKHVFNYFRDNNLLTPHQSGFRPGDSTVNQLSYLYHVFAHALDNKKELKIVFCDISKAFDRCWHDGILFKLRSLGIGGDLITWFKNYLTDRYQRVVIRGQSSEAGVIKAGVPQGSVLGPLLFLVYINDLPSGIRSNIKLFADDATIYLEFKDANQAAEVLNEDLSYIQAWADQWLVKFSPTKTKSMTISFKRDNTVPPLTLNNVVLDNVEHHKHLGITISKNLSWSLHVRNILDSVSTMGDVLKKLKYQVDRKSLETIYFTFIRPKLEYGCHIWDNCNTKDSNLLEKFQLDIARTVSGARKGTGSNIIYQELGWHSLKSRREASKLKYFSNVVNKDTPPYLYELLPGTVGESRVLRHSNNIRTMKCRTETFNSSFIPTTIRLWNSLEESNRNSSYINNLNKVECNELFNFGKRDTSVKLAQLRMKCSKLNSHLFGLHVIDSPACQCGFNHEDTNHYLLNCPLYTLERNVLYDKLADIEVTTVTEQVLLQGSPDYDLAKNILIFTSIFAFIETTGRL